MDQTRNKTKPRMTRPRLVWGAIALASTIAVGTASTKAQEVLPADARPLAAVELLMLVKDHSWKWTEGAGRFLDKDRRFLAFTRAEDGASIGEGHFVVTDGGRLCLVAIWRGATAAGEAKTCFQHMQASDVIYQRREPDGDWYIFKHNPTRETDEYAKFTKEDLVSEEFLKLKAEMEASGSAQKGNGP